MLSEVKMFCFKGCHNETLPFLRICLLFCWSPKLSSWANVLICNNIFLPNSPWIKKFYSWLHHMRLLWQVTETLCVSIHSNSFAAWPDCDCLESTSDKWLPFMFPCSLQTACKIASAPARSQAWLHVAKGQSSQGKRWVDPELLRSLQQRRKTIPRKNKANAEGRWDCLTHLTILSSVASTLQTSLSPSCCPSWAVSGNTEMCYSKVDDNWPHCYSISATPYVASILLSLLSQSYFCQA